MIRSLQGPLSEGIRPLPDLKRALKYAPSSWNIKTLQKKVVPAIPKKDKWVRPEGVARREKFLELLQRKLGLPEAQVAL